MGPWGRLVLAADGHFYGTTSSGGTSNDGTAFKIDAGGNLVTLHTFGGNDGSSPFAGLIQASDGNFYGTTSSGGTGSCDMGCGTVFKMDTSGTLTTLHSFATTTEGAHPRAGLVRATDGNFYGTTVAGGAENLGTIFKVDSEGDLTVLHSFAGPPSDGAKPYGGLIQASDGNYYGTTSAGGASDGGSIFRMDSSGNVTTVHSFVAAEGLMPVGELVQGKDGDFYGVTSLANENGCCGTVFKIDSSGNLITLHKFGGFADGAFPAAGLIQAPDGSFYGTTYSDGVPEHFATNGGTIFKIDSAGNLTTLHIFGENDGSGVNGLLLSSDGSLYATAAVGGSGNGGRCLQTDFRLADPQLAKTTAATCSPFPADERGSAGAEFGLGAGNAEDPELGAWPKRGSSEQTV
jgi:uncharacterized repeat protein (TIGR03803 family)